MYLQLTVNRIQESVIITMGISGRVFNRGKPTYLIPPFFPFLRKLNYFQIFNVLGSRAGWSLVLSVRVPLVTIRAFPTFSSIFSISLLHDFHFSTFHLDFIVPDSQLDT